MSNLRTFILVVSVFIAAGLAKVIVEMRRRCPDCGRRGFRRLVMHHGDYDDTPGYVIRECKSCRMKQVECHRGVEQLPVVGYERAAKEYVRNAEPPPHNFEVIPKDATESGDDAG